MQSNMMFILPHHGVCESDTYRTISNRMLRTALNIHWNQLLTNEQLYGSLPKISEKIRRRRLKLAGHCRRSDGVIAANLVLWTPKYGQRKQGRPALTYIDLL